MNEVKPDDVAPWVQIKAGAELARLVALTRRAPGGQCGGFLHSNFDAEQLLWRWALKWAPSIAEAPQPRVPAPAEAGDCQQCYEEGYADGAAGKPWRRGSLAPGVQVQNRDA